MLINVYQISDFVKIGLELNERKIKDWRKLQTKVELPYLSSRIPFRCKEFRIFLGNFSVKIEE